MMIIVKYFGAVADVTLKKEERLYLEDETNSISGLKTRLEQHYPEIKNIAYTFALNHTAVTEDTLINENDELALLPPFAGG
jgi:molybdopterin synthase sulfur carrier subunit